MDPVLPSIVANAAALVSLATDRKTDTGRMVKRQRQEDTAEEWSLRNPLSIFGSRGLARHLPQTSGPRPKSRLDTINNDVFLEILKFVFGGTFTIHLNKPHDSHQLATLFQVCHSIRDATFHVVYKMAKFYAGAEILCRKEVSFVPHCTLRPEMIRHIRHLTLPATLVRAFSSPDCDEESYARFFKELVRLTVEFDAGWWDLEMEEPATSGRPKAFVEAKVKNMFVDRPHFMKWFGSEKEYKVKLRLRFPVNAGVYATTIIEEEGDVEKKEEAPKALCAVGFLWKDAVLVALEGKDVSFHIE